MRQLQENAQGKKTITLFCDHANGCTKKITIPISGDGKNWKLAAIKQGWYVTARTEICSSHCTHIKD